MIRFRRLALGPLLPLVAVIIFVVLLAVSLIRMTEVENAMHVEAEENMLRVFHQSEVAARRLAETAARIDLGEADTDEPALRFDILKGRVAMLHDGPQRRFVEKIGHGDDLERITASLEVMAPIIADFSPADGPRLRAALYLVERRHGRPARDIRRTGLGPFAGRACGGLRFRGGARRRGQGAWRGDITTGPATAGSRQGDGTPIRGSRNFPDAQRWQDHRGDPVPG